MTRLSCNQIYHDYLIVVLFCFFFVFNSFSLLSIGQISFLFVSLPYLFSVLSISLSIYNFYKYGPYAGCIYLYLNTMAIHLLRTLSLYDWIINAGLNSSHHSLIKLYSCFEQKHRQFSVLRFCFTKKIPVCTALICYKFALESFQQVKRVHENHHHHQTPGLA